jgi:hypothetical protein
LPLAIGQSLDFLFDFGDNWEFELQLEAVNPKVKQKNPEVLEAEGEAPEQYPYGDEDGAFFFEVDENGEMILYFDEDDENEDFEDEDD